MSASELIEHLQSYIKHTGGDCEVLIFDKAGNAKASAVWVGKTNK